MGDAVSTNVSTTYVKAGTGNIIFQGGGTASIFTPNDETTVYVENGAVTWAKRNASSWYGWGALGTAGDGYTFSTGLSESGGVVTLAAITNNTVLGNISGVSAIPVAITGTQITTLLDTFSTSASTKGVVPGSSGGGASVFLNGAGGWTVPVGTGWQVTGTTTLTGNVTILASDEITFQDFNVFNLGAQQHNYTISSGVGGEFKFTLGTDSFWSLATEDAHFLIRAQHSTALGGFVTISADHPDLLENAVYITVDARTDGSTLELHSEGVAGTGPTVTMTDILAITGIETGTDTQVLYRNATTGKVTAGAAPTSPTDYWKTAGTTNLTASTLVRSLSAEDIEFQANNAGTLYNQLIVGVNYARWIDIRPESLDTQEGVYLILNAWSGFAPGMYGIHASDMDGSEGGPYNNKHGLVVGSSSVSLIAEEDPALGLSDDSSLVVELGEITLNSYTLTLNNFGGDLFLSDNLATATTSNVLYFDTTTGKVTHGAAPSGGGGGGITNGGAANELVKSDGTNVVGANLFSTSSTLLTIGSGTGVATYDITAASGKALAVNGFVGDATNNTGGNLTLKAGDAYATSGNGGGGDITLTVGNKRSAGSGETGHIILNATVDGTLYGAVEVNTLYTIFGGPGLSQTSLQGFDGTVSSTAGNSVLVTAGHGYGVNGAGGNLTLASGITFVASVQEPTMSGYIVFDSFSGSYYLGRDSNFSPRTIDSIFYLNPGVASSVNGKNFSIVGGDAYGTSGDGNGGSILIQSGQRRTAGTGVDGNLHLDYRTGNLGLGTSAGSFGSGKGVVFIANATTVPTTDPTGGVIQYVESGVFKLRDTAGNVFAIGIPQQRTITLQSPSNSENAFFFYTERAILLTKVVDVVRGSSTPSITWNVKYASTRDSGSPTSAFTSDRTTTSTSGTSTTTINNASIPAGSYVWVTSSAVSGTVNELSVSLIYNQL
jgi:hypothetical protein